MQHRGSAISSLPDTSPPETSTSDPSSMSVPTISPDTINVTSSPASASGRPLCATSDGPTTSPSGPAPARASLSARQAKEAGLLTSGTYGPPSSISSASAGLQSCLENRLRARMGCAGSILFRLTWKERLTPSGRPICASGTPARLRQRDAPRENREVRRSRDRGDGRCRLILFL